jgi:Uma2 family endonuclease
LPNTWTPACGWLWYFDPRRKTVRVFTGTGNSELLSEHDNLTGGDVLPGFTLSIKAFFQEPLEEAGGGSTALNR